MKQKQMKHQSTLAIENPEVEFAVTVLVDAKKRLEEVKKVYEKARGRVLELLQDGRYIVGDWNVVIFERVVPAYGSAVETALGLIESALAESDWGKVRAAMDALKNPPLTRTRVVTIE